MSLINHLTIICINRVQLVRLCREHIRYVKPYRTNKGKQFTDRERMAAEVFVRC